eukprot:g3528.t1
MDFEGNLRRIKHSIHLAREAGAKFRVGPELEITGYSCEDHFLERDTTHHAWECLLELIQEGYTDNIVCDLGMPVEYQGLLYNCRVYVLNSKVLLIRPKIWLADYGNYREKRYFSSWSQGKFIESFVLPFEFQTISKQCPFGDAILCFNDGNIGSEICAELFTPIPEHLKFAFHGVEIITNGSGSHHQLRKLDFRLNYIQGSTEKWGGIYLYANQRGCDGGRLYFDGCCCIVQNGKMLKQGAQFGLEEVEVISADVDLDEVVDKRRQLTLMHDQASTSNLIPCLNRVHVDFNLTKLENFALLDSPIEPRIPDPEEELVYGPACWLWDYLRRSGATGFLLSLSGGADSSSVAAIVGAMSQMVITACQQGNTEIITEVRRIGQYNNDIELPTNAKEFANRIFTTIYQKTVNSSQQTRSRAGKLAEQIGAFHVDVNIDLAVEAVVKIFQIFSGKIPKFQSSGGTQVEDLALQNIQARLRMVIAFTFSQLLPWFRGRKGGFLLVLSSANVDEALRGYMTKYDCSSGDLNPIGGISKTDLYRLLKWGSKNLQYPALLDVVNAVPTAELRPHGNGVMVQIDEEEMKMTYAELSDFGRLRKETRCGPVSMFRELCSRWNSLIPDRHQIAEKVKTFFYYYSINRHKSTTLTPSYHAETYSQDDNRFDLRQFLYNSGWNWQFKKIDEMI